jgi:hypothetical protein
MFTRTRINLRHSSNLSTLVIIGHAGFTALWQIQMWRRVVHNRYITGWPARRLVMFLFNCWHPVLPGMASWQISQLFCIIAVSVH